MDSDATDLESLQVILLSATENLHVGSAAFFVRAPDSTGLVVAAAAGISGAALEGLAAAVRDPTHPIARTLVDGEATFDVAPRAPGGPALRSHLPLLADHGGRQATLGVLAVAHENPLDEDARRALVELADRAASAIHASSALDRAP